MISLTFDDGWKNQYIRALPILEKYNFKGTFYIISRMPEFMLQEGEGRMTQEDINDLSNKGHEIGAHSQTHPFLDQCTYDNATKEILGSKEDLEKKGLNIKTFCYPYGNTSSSVSSIVEQSGFLGARLAEGGYNTVSTNRFNLEAKCLRDFTSFEEVKNWVDSINNRWLILVFHQIESNPGGWGTEPELFEKICHYIKEKNLEVVTINEGLNKIL